MIGAVFDLLMAPFRVGHRNRIALDQLERHGLSPAARQTFLLACRAGVRTPDWVVEEMTAAVERARAAGEERES